MLRAPFLLQEKIVFPRKLKKELKISKRIWITFYFRFFSKNKTQTLRNKVGLIQKMGNDAKSRMKHKDSRLDPSSVTNSLRATCNAAKLQKN